MAPSHILNSCRNGQQILFAVLSEEFGLTGIILLLSLYLFIIQALTLHCNQAQDTFNRLLGSIDAGFLCISVRQYRYGQRIVAGGWGSIAPDSYGTPRLVTIMAGFGILMSIHTHRKLLPT